MPLEVSDPRFPMDGLRFATVNSPALGGRADLTLFAPPECAGLRDVPVVILLHGVYGSHWAWALHGGAHRTVRQLMAAGQIPPLVLAMPSDGLWGEGSGYVPHADRDFERWIVGEVPAVVNQVVPSTSVDSPLFLAGLSMGGFGALRLGGKHPRRYRAVSGHSSATHVEQLRRFAPDGLRGWSPAAEDRSVLDALKLNAAALPPFRFDCGTEDSLLEANRELHRELESAGIPHFYAEFPGGHTWAYWEQHLADSLRFFADTLRNPPKPVGDEVTRL